MTDCVTCNDTGHVCEDHPTRPWGGLCCDNAAHAHTPICEHGACGCGGWGQPCGMCCPPGPFTIIGKYFTPPLPMTGRDLLRQIGPISVV